MKRFTFLLRALPGREAALEQRVRERAATLRALFEGHGIQNASMWTVAGLFFGYGEEGEDFDLMAEAGDCFDGAEMLCGPGAMRLMYHDIGVVRADKSLIRHRVFATRLKPGCAEEYKRRHDALIAARGDAVSEGPDSDFTIWYGAGYIFGYCEKVKSFDHPMTDEERAETVAWETRQLEIMDWLTDDVDWMTGEHHASIRRVR